MILEPGELKLLAEIKAHRRRAFSEPDPMASNLAQERSAIALAHQHLRDGMEQLLALTVASEPLLVLPAGVEMIGIRNGRKGTELWFNAAPDAEGGRTTFVILLTEVIAAKHEAMRGGSAEGGTRNAERSAA